jgi:hypothetical protein
MFHANQFLTYQLAADRRRELLRQADVSRLRREARLHRRQQKRDR